MKKAPTTLLLVAVCTIHGSIGSNCGAGCEGLLKWGGNVYVCVYMYVRERQAVVVRKCVILIVCVYVSPHIVHFHVSGGMPCMELGVYHKNVV